MKIQSFTHKGLKNLYAEDDARKIPAGSADKLIKMLAYLDSIQEPEELLCLTSWTAHKLSGDRKGTWSLSVTRNLRLTFRFSESERGICDVNLEDYH